jgi:hypothetical protein
MRAMGEFFISCFVFFKVKWFLYKERREIRRHFPAFLPFERALDRVYRFHNPFHICKEYLKQRGEQDLNAYGETPLPVLARIAQECHLNSKDVFFDLGCGRGRGSMFLSHLTGCQVIGIDWVPFFIQNAQNITASIFPRLLADFRCVEMQSVDLSGATIIFLYGTCLSDEVIADLISRFERLSSQTRIITVSYPLSDYSSRFYILKQFTSIFPWGEGEIYVNLLNASFG